MQCLKCQREIPLKLGYVSNCYRYCQQCFNHIIEKRVRKYIKEHYPLKRGQRIAVTNAISNYFVKNVLHVPVTLIKKAQKKSDIFVSLATLDDIVVSFLEYFFHGEKIKKTRKINKNRKNELLLFSTITDEELSLYCQYHQLPFTPKKNKIKELLQKLEQEHPGTLYALYKSTQDLKEIF